MQNENSAAQENQKTDPAKGTEKGEDPKKVEEAVASDQLDQPEGGVKVEASDDISGAEKPPIAPGVDLKDSTISETVAPKETTEPKPEPTATETVPGKPDPVEAEGEKVGDEAISMVNSTIVFLIGLGVLSLFVWYLATEKSVRKRLVGSLLTLAVGAMSAWFYFDQGMEKGIEIQGGVSMNLKIQPGEDSEVTPDVQEQAIKVLMNRLNKTSTKEIVLQKEGDDGLFLQIPGLEAEKVDEITERLEQVAVLEFAVLDRAMQLRADAMAAGDDFEPGFEVLKYTDERDKEGKLVERGYAVVPDQTDLSGDIVSGAKPRFGNQGWEIIVDFKGEGPKVLGRLTKENEQQPLAIILDEEVISAPNINEPFSDSCVITGSFTKEEARELAAALENPLKNPIEVANSNFISPTLGAETVKQGLSAGIAGLILTLLFILFYYRLAGLVAMVGMAVAIAFIFGMMALFQFTLTLPGIAGIILTIGIAIDANVLIYERLREEMAAGKSLGSAITTAYEKAFSAIIDANITTLITAIILYAVAIGTVKGFAVTLMIGILATLFTALLVTRVCFNWGTDTGLVKKLGFANFVPEKMIDFLGKRRKAVVASITLIIVSLIAVPVMDPRGVDLAGGDAIIVRSESLVKKDVDAALDTVQLAKKPSVQVQSPVNGGSDFFLIRAQKDSAPKIEESIRAVDTESEPAFEIKSVGSEVGQSMLWQSMLAVALALGAIMLYVTLRFEFAFALGAIVALGHDLIITLGVTTLLGQELTLISIGALLTIAGYSINDTIVVFDRVREGLATKRGDVKDVINHSLNATLGRTLLTSVTTLFIVVVLYLFGGPALRNFALVLIVGVMIGTYSSIFVASPIVLWWARRTGTNLRREVLDTEQAKIDPMTAG